MMMNEREVKDILNLPEPKNKMGDDEWTVQLIKILIGCVVGIFVVAILFQINHNLTTLIVQDGKIINGVCKYENCN